MTNPTAGHTSATGMGSDAQGLRDGDGLTSPSLTNLYEGLHGNGIMRLGDGAKGDSLRNSVVANTPGFIQIGSSQGEVKVYGGFCTLDGVLYKFANGPGSHETFIVGTTGGGASHSGDLPSVPGSNSDVFVVVYLVGRSTPEAHLMYEMGTPAAATSGTPLLPNRFLSSPSVTGNTDLNHQTTVLGVIRYTMSGGAANVTASLGSPVIHDRRTFLRKSPLYLTPMTKGAIGNVDAANALTNPDSFFASPEEGDLTGSTFGAIWQTHREDVAGAKHGVILTALPKNLNTTPVTGTYVLGPDRLEVITTSGNVTFTFDEANIWVITTDAARTINPTGVFSAGHVVDIFHKAGAHNLHFDSTSGGHSSTPINVNIASGESARFVYDGDNWHQVIAAPSSFPSSSGATGLVQLSNGSGGFTSDTKLAWASGSSTLTVDGKLTVTGLIDPTGLVIDEKANVAGTGHSTAAGKGLLWVKNDAPNRLYFTDDAGTDKKVIHATDSVTELSDVSNVGSGAIITGSERSKLSGIEANADVTDATNVTAAGALMDSEVTNLAFVKGLTGGVSNGNVLVANAAVADNDFLKIDGTSVEGRTAAEMRGDLNVADGATANAGTVTSVATTAPITGGTITGSGTIGISAATTSAAGSMSGADKTKLDAIEASADVTDATNVASAISGASLTGATVATDDKVLIQDTNDSDNLKTVTTQAIADLGSPDPLYFTAKVGSNTNDSGHTAGTWHKVEYWDIINNETLTLDSATDGEKFTVGSGQGGLYSIHAQVGWVASNSTLPSVATSPYQLHVAIYVNGSVVVRQGTATVGSPSAKTAPVSTEIVLADSDYVEIYFFVRKEDDTGNSGTQQLRGGEYCRWAVRRIGDS